MKVWELIDLLEDCEPDSEVRLATQPAWPFENEIDDVLDNEGVVYVSMGEQIGYLPEEVKKGLGW